jgi:hypothetical protein
MSAPFENANAALCHQSTDMTRWSAICAGLVVVGVALGGPAAVRAQDDYAVEPEHTLSLRALLDLRVVSAGPAPSWTDRGSGATRYGGVHEDGRFERVTRFSIAQLALEPEVRLPWGLTGHAQVNWEGNVDDRGNVGPRHDAPRLVEGWVEKDWSHETDGWALLAGVSNPSFSLEHGAPAWTPRYTLTPSALDTWLWEEGRVLGLRGEWWGTARGCEVNAFAGAGWGPDEQGILLAERGWVLSDWMAGENSTIVLPSPGAVAHEFDERDGRPALYAGLDLRDPWKVGDLRLGYYDNLGNQAVAGVWETRYGIAGIAVQPLRGLDVVFQYLIGETATRATSTGATSTGAAASQYTIQALYPLVSYRWRNHRLTVRYDDFRVVEHGGGPANLQRRGEAVTIAYLFEFWLRHRLALEYLGVDRHRSSASQSEPSGSQIQLSYRFRF